MNVARAPRRSAGVVVLTIVFTVLSALVAIPSANAASDQFVFFDGRLTHDWNKYAAITNWGGPSNWRSPVDYANGRMYFRLGVLDKPSTKAVDVQVCVWRDSYKEETCSGLTRFTGEGTYWIDLGKPLNWWKLNGVWSWAKPWDVTRVMLKDAATQKLLLTRSCGAHCYTGSDINDHVPIELDVSLIVVAPGSTLEPPAKWAGCPTTWSTKCTGSGSTSSTTASSTTSTSTTSTSTTSTTSPTTPPPPGGRSIVMVSGMASAPSGDRPVRDRLLAAGHSVTVVDDDALVPASLSGADAVIVMSSVVPSKIPAWLGDVAIPLLSNESYAAATLGLATKGADVSGQTRLDIASGHPIAGSASGVTPVTGSAQPFAAGTPGSGATTIATLNGDPRAAVFAYESGAQTTDGPAAARRVGFFLAYTTPAALNGAGWGLFDRAVTWMLEGSGAPTPGGRNAVMIAGNASPPSGDVALKARLEALGFTVSVVDDDALVPASLSGADLVVVMSSVVPSKVPSWLSGVAVPLLSNESYAAATLRLGASGLDVTGRTQLSVAGGSHPIAGAAAGTVTVTSSATHAYLTPASGATVVATQTGSPARVGIAAYETGAALTTGTAPARRVAFFLGYDAPARTNANGWSFFDAAVNWLVP